MMSRYYTTGSWTVTPGHEDAFVEAWSEFAAWGSGHPGAGTLVLNRDLDAPESYISFGDWESFEAVRNWKDSPEFRERIAQVLQHVSQFEPRNLAEIATAAAGASTGAVAS
jgi:heme-degrading monooxygenase HmoA